MCCTDIHAPRGNVGGVIIRAGAVLVLCAVLTACGSSNDSVGEGASSTPAPVGSSPDATTLAAITKAYDTFFAPDSSDQQIADSVQNGQELVVPEQAQDQSKYQGKSGVVVNSVTMQSGTVAKVTFTVTIDGSPMLPNAPGYAVQDGGTWKIAATTFCQLVTLENINTVPKGCTDPAQTAFPSE